MLSKKYVLSMIMAFAATIFLTTSNPVSATETNTLTNEIISVETPSEACDVITEVVARVNSDDPNVQGKVITCRVAPAPLNEMAFYVLEIVSKQNGVLVTYGWLFGNLVQENGNWVLAGKPDVILSLDTEPVVVTP